jgi:putative heme transporter
VSERRDAAPADELADVVPTSTPSAAAPGDVPVPVQPDPVEAQQDDHDDDEQPRMGITRQRALLFALFVASAIAFMYIVVPQLGDVSRSWGRLDEGDPWWLAAAVVFQIASMVAYIGIFRGVHVPPGYPIGWVETYRITMASLAATRLFAAGGAGGVALTAWALRQSGMERRDVATRMIAFLVLTYAVYMIALVVCGFGLHWGLFHGEAPYALTMIPAYIGLAAIVVFTAIAFLPKNIEDKLGSRQGSDTFVGKIVHAILTGPSRLGDGTRFAVHMLRNPDLALLGTIGWWGCSVGVLFSCFAAFGEAPPVAVVIEGFFVGMLANLLPLPGGIGGVDAGMIGVFAAFDVDGGLALVAVLTYRLFAFWLPSIPGAIAYITLRRTVARWKEERERNGGEDLGTIRSEATT